MGLIGSRSSTPIAIALVALVISACGQARAAAPPDPQFTSGQRAAPTAVPIETVPSEGEIVLPSDVEPDVDDEIDVGALVIVDDAGSVAPNASGWERFDVAIERRLGRNQAFGVAVMLDGELVHHAAFGDRVPGGDDVSTADRFRIASISKTITAIVIMQLVEEGILTLDDPVGDVVIQHLGLSSPDPDARTITVRQLLNHTAGLPQHEGTFFRNGATSCVDAATKGLSSGVASGGGYRYSNMGYCVLGVLIEAVTGMAYERVVDDRLLRPLGIGGMRMTSTYELGPDEVSHTPTPNRNFMETLGAAGSWNATPIDLVTILNSIDHATPGWKSISAESAHAMRYRVDDGRPPAGYGLGLINYDANSYGHTGTIQNTHAMLLHEAGGLTWAITVAGNHPSSSRNLRGIMRSAMAEAFG